MSDDFLSSLLVDQGCKFSQKGRAAIFFRILFAEIGKINDIRG